MSWERVRIHPYEPYRTTWRRIGAAFLDGLVFLPLGWLDAGITAAVSHRGALAVWIIFYSFSYYGYSILMHARYGQTIGKRICGIAVLDLSLAPLRSGQAVRRDLVPLVLTAAGLLLQALTGDEFSTIVVLFSFTWSVWMLLEILTMFTNVKRRALHDLIAGSVVVRVRPQGADRR